MATVTDEEAIKILRAIFPPKPDAIASELSEEMVAIVEAAKELGLTWIPTIVIEEEPQHDFTGRLDFNHYNETTIRISKIFRVWYNDPTSDMVRTSEKMCKTLAHELGHCYHFQTEGNKASYNYSEDGTFDEKGSNMGYCERFADTFRDKVLALVEKQS